MSKKKRADELLVEQNLAANKNEAAAFIMAGDVFTVDEIKVLTPGESLSRGTELYIKGRNKKYVSRGGLKLEKAISEFDIHLKDKIALDIGASTGGFTDVALKNGAKLVYALDVGTNQLAWELRSHDQVEVMEQTNFRYSKPEDFNKGQPNFSSIDVSFISLELIFSPLAEIIAEEGEVVALIKPQFEAAREDVGEGGIVNDFTVFEGVLKKVIALANEYNFQLLGLKTSPITGSKGNIEFLAYFKKTKKLNHPPNIEESIAQVLNEARTM